MIRVFILQSLVVSAVVAALSSLVSTASAQLSAQMSAQTLAKPCDFMVTKYPDFFAGSSGLRSEIADAFIHLGYRAKQNVTASEIDFELQVVGATPEGHTKVRLGDVTVRFPDKTRTFCFTRGYSTTCLKPTDVITIANQIEESPLINNFGEPNGTLCVAKRELRVPQDTSPVRFSVYHIAQKRHVFALSIGSMTITDTTKESMITHP